MGDNNTTTAIAEGKQRSLANLKPFKKGQSGNPKGKEPGTVSIVEGIRRKLLEVEPGTKKQYLELFLSSYFKNAIKDGDNNLMRDMINRIDGMPKQSTDITTDGHEIKGVVILPEQNGK